MKAFKSTSKGGSAGGTVVVIDKGVKNYQDLVDIIPNSADVVFIEPESNGLAQIASALEERSGLEAVHVVSHGAAGELKLGATQLNTEALSAHQEELATLGNALLPDGDLLLYGCNVGRDDEGRHFIDRIGEFTDVDVAASNDLTGAEALGGDWDLETLAGSIETSELEGTSAFQAVLAQPSDEDYSDNPGDGALIDITNSGRTVDGITYTTDGSGDNDATIETLSTLGVSSAFPSKSPSEKVIYLNGLVGSAPPTYFEVFDSDGDFFKIESIFMSVSDGLVANRSENFLVEGWDGSNNVVASDNVDFTTSDSSGSITYADSKEADYGGVLTFGSDWENITKIRLTGTDPGVGSSNAPSFILDDIDFEPAVPPNTAPTFDTGSPSITLHEDGSAASINSLLSVTDRDSGDPLTWVDVAGPSNGSLGGFNATATSNGGSVIPTGLTYTPNADFSGSDSFDVQIGDGTDTNTVTVNVTVNDAPEVNSINRGGIPGSATTNADVVTFAVTFSEAVAGVDAGDFTVTGGTSAGVTNVSTSDDITWSVEVSGGDLANFDGTVGLNLTDDDSINSQDTTTSLGGVGTSGAGDGSHTGDQEYTLDNTVPIVTDANISISGATGNGGAFINGDTLTASWDNRGTGDNNGDISGVTFDFSALGGGTSVAATNASGIWSATYTIDSTSAVGNDLNVSATATDDVGNTTTQADSSDATVDGTPPDAPASAPELLAGDDSGSSNSDDVTKATDPTMRVALAGTNAVAGDSVEVLLGGSALATPATATLAAGDISNGYVDIAISDGDLGADGSKSLTARVTDAAGNVGAASAARSLTLDTTAPAAPGQPDLAAGDDTGASNTDDVTSENSLALSGGGALVNETVQVSSSIDGVIGTTTADGAGNWSLTTSALGDGTHAITATSTDLAGNTSGDATPLSVTVDTTAPAQAPTITTPIEGDDAVNATEDTDVVVAGGGVEAGASVDVTIDDSNGATAAVTQQVSADGNGDWTLAGGNEVDVSGLDEGALTVSVVQTDTAGNASSAGTQSLTHDTTAPGIASVSTNVGGDTINDSDLGNDFTITVDFNEAMNQAVTPTSISFPSEDPTNTLTASPSYSFLDGDTLAITYASDDLIDVNEVVQAIDLKLNGVEDAAGNSADLSQADVFSVITQPAPGVSRIDSSTSDGSYGVGESVNVTVTFDKSVDFSANGGTLAATLSNGETVTLAGSDFTGQSSVGGSYSISEGETDSADLDVTGIELTGGATLDDGIQSADLSVPAGESLADNQDLVVDANTPDAPASAPELLAGDDSGSSNGDDVTNVTDPTLRVDLAGTNAVAGDSVEVLLGGASLGTPATATLAAGDISNGYVDIAVTDGDLGSDGSKSLTARVTDEAGNVGSASAARSLTLDTTAPGAPGQADLLASSDTGASDSDEVTKAANVALTGNGALANGMVQVSSDINGVIGTTTADGAGNWSLTTSALGDGTHAITATSTDLAGNTSGDATPLSVTVDTTAPAQAPTITTPIEGDDAVNATEDTDVVVAGGGVEAGASVDVTIDDSNGATAAVTQQVSADGNGDWTLAGGNEVDVSGLDEGALTVSVVQTDTAGNASSAGTQSLTHDTSAPGIASVSTNVGGDTINDSDLGNDFTITVDFNEAMNQAVTPTSISFPSEDPTNTLTASPSYSFLDGDTLAITYASDDLIDVNEVVQAIDLKLNGVEDAAGNSADLSQADVFSIITQPAPGVSRIDSSTSDGSYGVGESVNVTVTFDKSVDFSANGGTLAATLSNGETVTLAGSDFTGQSSVGGSYSISEGETDSADLDVTGIELTGGATLDDGIQSADLSVPAGESLADNQDLVVDANTPDAPASAPELLAGDDSGISNNDGITTITTPTITGSAEANATVYVRVGGSSVGTTAADGNGDWSYTFSAGDLPSGGTNAIDVVASDGVNDSAASPELSLNVDVTSPTANEDSGYTAPESATSNTLSGLNVTANDTGAAGAIAATGVVGSNGGLLDVNPTGAVSFDANGEFERLAVGETATTSFQVTVLDLAGNTATASLGVEVQGENNAPVIETNSGPSVEAGQSVTVGTSNLEEGDPDDDGSELTYTLTSAPGSGTLFLSGTALGANDTFTQQDIDNGNLSFSAPGNAGTVTFDFTLSDGDEDGAGDATGSLSIDVTPPPPPPDPDPEPNEDDTDGDGEDDDLFDGDDQAETDNDIDTGLDQTNDFEDTTIDGAPGTRGTTTDRDTGEPVEVTVVDRVTGDERQDDNDATEDVDVEIGSGVRASLSDNLGLIATRRTSDSRDNVRTVIDRESASGGESGIDEADREAFLDETVRAGQRTGVVEIVPTYSESSNEGSDDEQRISVAIGASDDGGERGAPLVIVDSRNLGGNDPGGGGISGSTINIAGSGSLVVRGSGAFQGNEERSPEGGPDIDNVLGDNTDQDLFFGPGDDIIRGAGGDDMVASAGGDDRLFGGSGDDTLTGGAGGDWLNGGEGGDTADYSREPEIGMVQAGLSHKGVLVNLDTGVALDGHGEVDRLESIENAEGTSYADMLRGDNGSNTLAGHGGDDMIHGGGGGDEVSFAGARADYDIVRDHARTLVREKETGETATVINAETLAFDDGDYAVENSAFMAPLATLYEQVLDRQADLDGFQYWSEALASGKLELGEVAVEFLTSEEFTDSRQGIDALASPAEQVDLLYKQLLGRSSDASGKAYWVAEMNSGTSLADVAQEFVASTEMQDLYTQSTEWDFLIGAAGGDRPNGGEWGGTADYSRELEIGIVQTGLSPKGVLVNLATGVALDGHGEINRLESTENAEGTSYADMLRGGSGSNTLAGHGGEDIIHGGSGIDEVLFAGRMADYDIIRDHAQTLVREKETGETATVVNAETLVFDNGDHAVENSAAMDPLATLYEQVLGRQADLDGFQYWIEALASGKLELGEVAVEFLTSEEFTDSRQGINALESPAQKVDLLYEQLLGRSSDASGKAYWVAEMNSGTSLAIVAQEFVDSAEMQDLYTQSTDWDFIL